MMQGWYYVESLTGQWHDRVQTESQIATVDSCFDLIESLQHGVASCEALSFQRSISLASLFTCLSIFGWSDLLQILRKQAAFSFAVLCIIMFCCLIFHIFLNLTSSLRKNISFPKCPKLTEAYRCHPTSDFKNPTSDIRRVKIRHPTCKNQTSDLLKSDIRLVI